MTLLLIDDHILLRQSLARVLTEQLGAEVFEAGNAAETARFSQRPDLILLDLNLGYESGLTFLPQWRERWPGVRVLVVSMHTTGAYGAAALKADVQGFVAKDSPLTTLIEAVRTTAHGGTWFDPRVLKDSVRYLTPPTEALFAGYRSLTPREQEVFLLLAQGKTTQEAAKHLRRSAKTIENHRSAVYQKLNLTDRYDLFRCARDLGLNP